MKSIRYLGFFLYVASGLFSCTRAVDEGLVKVQLQLPVRTEAVRSSPSILSGNAANLVDSSLDETKNLFSSAVPSLLSGADVPVNCYLLVVSGPDDDADLSKNYCAKKSAPGKSLVSDIKAPRLNFGPYVGLIDAFNYQNRIDLEMKPGDDRVFTLLGFNVAGSCSEIFSALRDKSKLSKAYPIGASSPQKLVPGDNTVTLGIISEVDPSDYFSDCVIPDPETIYPLATYANLDRPGFPNKAIRAFASAPTNGEFLCESIDVNLKATDPYTHLGVPGTVSQDSYYRINIAGQNIQTYDNERDCSTDTTGANSQPYIKFTKNQITQKTWFHQQSAQTGSVSYTLYDGDNKPIVTTLFYHLPSTTDYIVDAIVPLQAEKDICYQGTLFVRDRDGNVVSNSSTDLTFANTEPGTSTFFNIYQSLSECEIDSNINYPIVISSNSYSKTFFVKFIQISTGFDFILTPPTPGAGVPSFIPNNKGTPNVSVKATLASTDRSSLSAIRVNTKNSLHNDSTVTGNLFDCSPLFISFARPDGNEFVRDSSSNISLLDMTVQVADQTGPELSGYRLYSDDHCSSQVYPIGSSAEPTGTAIVNGGTGISFYKLYIKPDHQDHYGSRQLMFYYGSKVVGQVGFDLTDKHH